MDPTQTLRDMLNLIQQIGQLATLEGHLRNLDELSEKTADLREWLLNGGYAPDLLFFHTADELPQFAQIDTRLENEDV